MNDTNSASPIASQPPATISDLEQIIAGALEGLRPAPLSENITSAFPYLLPDGLRLRVQLEEDGRKKRSTAAASNWDPRTGEIVIYFERKEPESSQLVVANQPTIPASAEDDSSAKRQDFFAKKERERKAGLIESSLQITPATLRSITHNAILTTIKESNWDLDSEIKQLCVSLAESEKAGKSFIALKWFRDNELTTHGYTWAESLAYRQAVLARAIEVGAVLTTQIPNPKAPQHPTTTIRLNRESKYAQAVAPRFQPIQLRGVGPSASELLLRDRERL
jgi:hypothetical protein